MEEQKFSNSRELYIVNPSKKRRLDFTVCTIKSIEGTSYGKPGDKSKPTKERPESTANR